MPPTFPPYRYYAVVVLFLLAVVAGVSVSYAATTLPGQPLNTITISYSSSRPVVGTLIEAASRDQRFLMELDGAAVLHIRGTGRDAFELTQSLGANFLQGSPVTWTIGFQQQSLSVRIQSIQLQATPFQSFRLTLPSAWGGFRPTAAVRGSISSVVEDLVVRVNGVIVGGGVIVEEAPVSLQDPEVVEYAIQPVRNFSVGIGIRTIGLIINNVNNANGIITLQWNRYVDPLHLPRAGDIGFEIERSVDNDPFKRIEGLIAPLLSAREWLVPGTVNVVYDPLDPAAVRGKELTYRIRTVSSAVRSDPAESRITVKETDLALEGARLVDANTAGCDGVVVAYTVANRGYRPIGAFLTTLIADGRVERANGFGFSPFYIIDRNDFSRSRGRHPIGALFQPGSRIERTECLGALAVDRLHHIRVTADSTGGEAQVMLSEPTGGVPFRYTEDMVSEDDEANNNTDLSFVLKRCGERRCIQQQEGTAMELPDLVVENLQIQEHTLASVKFIYNLFNRGTMVLAGGRPFVVSYRVDGQEVRREEVARDWAIADGQVGGRTMGVVELRYPSEQVASTTHTLEVRVDSTNVIQELNEENNRIASSVVVARTLPDLVAESGRFSGRSYELTVRNVGAVDVADVLMRVDIDGRSSVLMWQGRSPSSPILRSNSEAVYTQHLPEGFDAQNSHRISITLDPENVIEESDELNNQWVERTGAFALLLTLSKEDARLSLLSASSIITNVPVEIVEGGEYVAELTEYSERTTEPMIRTAFTIPTETRLNQESGGGWKEQEITGSKTVVLAIPYTGVPHRLTIRENGVEQSVIQVAFNRDGTLEDAAAQTKIAGRVRTAWEKTQNFVKKMMCASFGRIDRLHRFFGCQ